jgi:2-polyprenyl-3-methyl-5-hydroxy-6-metoxy-1,4-benzoquinol methylase
MLPAETKLVGFEPSPQAATLQRQDFYKNVQFVQGDFLVESAEYFDLVLAIDVFEHVPDYLGFLKAIREHADYAVFHIPLDLTVLNLLNPMALAHTRNTLGHLHFFDRESALVTLKDCGYTIINEFLTNWIEELPHRASTQAKQRRLISLLKMLRGERMAVQLLGGHSLLVVAHCKQ